MKENDLTIFLLRNASILIYKKKSYKKNFLLETKNYFKSKTFQKEHKQSGLNLWFSFNFMDETVQFDEIVDDNFFHFLPVYKGAIFTNEVQVLH